jgi:heme exporter protein A
VVSARNLGKRFGRRFIFRHVEFDVLKGECLLVTGKNGSGKSTLLRLVADLDLPSEGDVFWEVNHLRRDLGYLSPELRLYSSLTGREHLQLAGSLRGCAWRDSELLDWVDLTCAADQLVETYSTGMRARLRLALAVQAHPSVLILDEPSMGMDSSGRELVAELVESQRHRGVCLLATNEDDDRRFGDLELRLA